MTDLISIIKEDLGYPLVNHGNYFSSPAMFRDGDNKTALAFYPNDNLILDFVEGTRYTFKSFIALNLNITDINEVDKVLAARNIVLPKFVKSDPKLELTKKYDSLLLNKLIPKHEYFIKRGISEKILLEFRAGLALTGKLRNRYIFPIFNKKEEIIGFSGRAIDQNNALRWFHMGSKKNWVYPAFLSHKTILEKREVILVEGIGDVLSLFECEIRNCLCLFGIMISAAIIKYLIAVNPKKIIIAVNNDIAGQEAAEKIKSKLMQFFDEKNIEIRLPTIHKDLNEILLKEGKEIIVKQYDN